MQEPKKQETREERFLSIGAEVGDPQCWMSSVIMGRSDFCKNPEKAEEPCAPKERSQEGRQHECWGQSKSLEFAELNQSPRKCWPLKPTFVGRGSALRQPSPECDVAEDKGGHMSPLVI